MNTSVCLNAWSLVVSIDRIKADTGAAEKRKRFPATARQVAEKPIVQRVYKLEDVGKKGRTWLDGCSTVSPTRKEFPLMASISQR